MVPPLECSSFHEETCGVWCLQCKAGTNYPKPAIALQLATTTTVLCSTVNKEANSTDRQSKNSGHCKANLPLSTHAVC